LIQTDYYHQSNMLKITPIDNKTTWNTLVQTFPDYTFLQSWQWGQVQHDSGETVYRLAMYQGDSLVSLCQFFTQTAKRGKILFLPHSPLFKNQTYTKYLKNWLPRLKNIAKDNHCLCIRISPLLEKNPQNSSLFKDLSFQQAPVIMHAEDTWLVDLEGDQDLLLGRMRKTTRNLIKKGLKDNLVWVKQSTDIKDIDTLYKLQLEVVKRNNFVPFSLKYLKTEANNFFQDNSASLFIAGVGDQPLASALIVFFGKFAFYYQSGSISSREPVNYLLQWNVLLEAQKRGCLFYNMWGIAPQGSDQTHPWYGLSLFKTGFGGFSKIYLPSFDYPLSPFYYLMRLIEKIPKTWRSKLISSLSS